VILARIRESSPAFETVITSGVQVRGKVVGGPNDVIRVDGRIQGEIETEGLLAIAPTGRVIADVRAREVVVAGVLQGNVLSAQRMTIEKTAQIYGDVHVATVRMEDGALIAGKIDIHGSDAAGAPSPPKPLPAAEGR